MIQNFNFIHDVRLLDLILIQFTYSFPPLTNRWLLSAGAQSFFAIVCTGCGYMKTLQSLKLPKLSSKLHWDSSFFSHPLIARIDPFLVDKANILPSNTLLY